MITGLTAAVPAVVETAKVAVVLPAATTTEEGTVAAALLLDSVTVVPPVGAALVRVTVPVDTLPRTTLAGLSETAESVGTVIVNVAVFETEL